MQFRFLLFHLFTIFFLKEKNLSKTKCIIILSEKSSGSSACQDFLAKYPDIHHVRWTRHNQNETLYWTKAASVLHMPQDNMLESEVPLKPKKAKKDLAAFLKGNLNEYVQPDDDKEMILAIMGCKIACADLSHFRGLKIWKITSVEDAEEFIKEMG